MADTLIAGTTLVEKESRSIGDVPVGGIVEFDETLFTIPDGYVVCDGATVTDPLSSYNGTAVPNLNTQYKSYNGYDFIGLEPDVEDISYGSTDGILTLNGGSITPTASINLPHGAILTGAVVYSNVTTEVWSLRSRNIADTADSIVHATASLNTEDTTITTATIDNSTKRYFLTIATLDATDIIYGARISYTPRLKFIIRIK